MFPLYSLWSGPRNISTALMYSFAQREDMQVVDEPLYGYYLYQTNADHPGREQIIKTMEGDPDQVLANCRKLTGNSSVFLKNMAHHAINLSSEWLEIPVPILLIRDPKDMLISLSKVLEKPVLRDTGLHKQHELLNKFLQRKKNVVVIEGVDILKDPQDMLGKLCASLGLPFDKAMLSWPAGPLPEDGIWAEYWYEEVHKSTGFKPWRPVEKTLPEKLIPLFEECLPYYEFLKSYKLT